MAILGAKHPQKIGSHTNKHFGGITKGFVSVPNPKKWEVPYMYGTLFSAIFLGGGVFTNKKLEVPLCTLIFGDFWR